MSDTTRIQSLVHIKLAAVSNIKKIDNIDDISREWVTTAQEWTERLRATGLLCEYLVFETRAISDLCAELISQPPRYESSHPDESRHRLIELLTLCQRALDFAMQLEMNVTTLRDGTDGGEADELRMFEVKDRCTSVRAECEFMRTQARELLDRETGQVRETGQAFNSPMQTM